MSTSAITPKTIVREAIRRVYRVVRVLSERHINPHFPAAHEFIFWKLRLLLALRKCTKAERDDTFKKQSLPLFFISARGPIASILENPSLVSTLVSTKRKIPVLAVSCRAIRLHIISGQIDLLDPGISRY